MKSEMIPLMEALKTIRGLGKISLPTNGDIWGLVIAVIWLNCDPSFKDEIHELAVRSLGEDWSEKALDYCKGVVILLSIF